MNATAATESSRPVTAPTALSVGQIVGRIAALIDRQFPLPLWVEGELSNVSCAASGHIYFNLKDERETDRRGQPLVLPCAFFRGANQHLKFELTDGLKLLCYGQVTTYPSRAQYQLQVLRAEPKGKGALQLAFEQLKQRLQAEGLFETSRKRPMPAMPERVGVVTSPSGSAVHDIVSKLRGWFRVVIVPAKVQGEGAAAEIVQAIDTANRLHLADVLIVGRGGGSVEDLWAFNEEPVARAIARSRIPVISAVGHQDDWTIADYVADVRASTPTDAAKRLLEGQEAFADAVRDGIERLLETMRQWLDEQSGQADALASQLRLLHPRAQLERCLARADALQLQLTQSMRHALAREEHGLHGLAGRLQALSPLAVLARGYSITRRLSDRRVVTSAGALHVGDALETLLARGRAVSTVSQVLLESAEPTS